MSESTEGLLNEGHRTRLLRLALDAMELPVIAMLARPLYRRLFRRPARVDNLYYGIYGSHDEARRAAEALSTARLPATYDLAEAARKYRAQLQQVRSCDYAAMFWLERALARGARKVFDLGGHIGLAYYGFGRYLDLPRGTDWCVHDVPQVMQAGRDWARDHDLRGALHFAGDPAQADGCDLLISSGALQYLDYSLPQLLQRLRRPPRHVLFNLTPLHPTRGYFTLQNLRIAICPYRVEGIPQLLAAMRDLGYIERDRWSLHERQLHVPFHPGHGIDRYYGFYFTRESDGSGE